MIQIVLKDPNRTIKNKRGSLAAISTKALDSIGIIDEYGMVEKRIANKILETLKEEGVIADVEIVSK